jgi:mono/diheme cytochrome c family protein
MARVCYLILVLGLLPFFRASAQTTDQVYLNYCSVCHGQHMEGERATPLIKTTWKYGNTRSAMIKNISSGIPDTEMPKWEGPLTTKQIESLADYILSLQKKPAHHKSKHKATHKKSTNTGT